MSPTQSASPKATRSMWPLALAVIGAQLVPEGLRVWDVAKREWL